jgi:DNA-binding MarR family transcriptional regulator
MAAGDTRITRARAGGTAVAADPLAVANRLRPVLLHLSRHLRRETHALGLTAGQASLLASIRGAPGIGVNELAVREGMSAPSMSGHIDRLEAMGMVARIRAESGDRRRVGLTATREGVRALDDVRRRRTAWLAQRLQKLDPADLDRIDDAVEALARLVEQA